MHGIRVCPKAFYIQNVASGVFDHDLNTKTVERKIDSYWGFLLENHVPGNGDIYHTHSSDYNSQGEIIFDISDA